MFYNLIVSEFFRGAAFQAAEKTGEGGSLSEVQPVGDLCDRERGGL